MRRFVLRGIVHGASGSGTTLYIEPEALVELNNRLKQSEIAIEHETRRVLAELSERTTVSRYLTRTDFLQYILQILLLLYLMQVVPALAFDAPYTFCYPCVRWDKV